MLRTASIIFRVKSFTLTPFSSHTPTFLTFSQIFHAHFRHPYLNILSTFLRTSSFSTSLTNIKIRSGIQGICNEIQNESKRKCKHVLYIFFYLVHGVIKCSRRKQIESALLYDTFIGQHGSL